MNFKKLIFAIVMFGFLSSVALCFPKKCCEIEFKRNVEDIVRSFLRGQLNRKLIATIYMDKLREIPLENEACNYLQYDIGCYEAEIHYSDPIAKKNDVMPKSFYLFAKEEDREALPLSVFFELCGKEEYYQPRTEITKAVFKYTEGDSPFIINILVKNVYPFEPALKNGFGRIIELTRYPKSWDEEK